MLDVAFALFVCGMYADTVPLLALVAGGVLFVEGAAFDAPVFSTALQVLLSLVLAMLMRRHLYRDSGALWHPAALLRNPDVDFSTERAAMVALLYVARLPYTRRTTPDDFPIGAYGSVLLVGMTMWVFDVFLRLRYAHKSHVRQHQRDDGSTQLARHHHAVSAEELYSIPVLCVAAVLIAYPDIVWRDPRLWPSLFPVLAVVGIFCVSRVQAALLAPKVAY